MPPFPSFIENDVTYTVDFLLKQLSTTLGHEQDQIRIRLQAEIDGIIDSAAPYYHYVAINNIQTSLDFVRAFSLTEASRTFVTQFMTIIILCDAEERAELKRLLV